MPELLAVDLGVKTGLALYGLDGRLVWYRSRNFGKRSRLKRGVSFLLDELSDVTILILEGGGDLAAIWTREAEARRIVVYQIAADVWRRHFFYPREHRTSGKAKQTADTIARQVIKWSNAPRPTSLRHDTAEAILIGLWGVLHVEWLAEIPVEIKR